MTFPRIAPLALSAMLLAACQAGGAERGVPSGEAGDAAIPDPDASGAYTGIDESETLRFTGTEPFWGGTASGASLTYTTPENPVGATVAVERFAGRGGLSLSGTLDGVSLVMSVTPGTCSDGMSDRSYPFTVTLKLGDELRNGCGWTERQPFSGAERP